MFFTKGLTSEAVASVLTSSAVANVLTSSAVKAVLPPIISPVVISGGLGYLSHAGYTNSTCTFTLTKENDNLKMVIYDTANSGTDKMLMFFNSIDLTDIENLVFDLRLASDQAFGKYKFGISPTANQITAYNQYASTNNANTVNFCDVNPSDPYDLGRTTFSYDVSSYNGVYYPFIELNLFSNTVSPATQTLNVFNIYGVL